MNTFNFLQQHFAKYILPQLTHDALGDSKRALTISHLLSKGTTSRLTGWVMVKEKNVYVQAALAAKHSNLVTADPRTRYEAWFEELEQFSGPTCFIEFTKSTFNIGNIFLTHDVRVVRVCGPSSVQTFNYLEEPSGASGMAHKVLAKLRKKKNAV
jgi:hypothetical protein